MGYIASVFVLLLHFTGGITVAWMQNDEMYIDPTQTEEQVCPNRFNSQGNRYLESKGSGFGRVSCFS